MSGVDGTKLILMGLARGGMRMIFQRAAGDRRIVEAIAQKMAEDELGEGSWDVEVKEKRRGVWILRAQSALHTVANLAGT